MKVMTNNKLTQKGIHIINDIIGNEGKFLNYNELLQVYNCKTNFLEYMGIVNSIKSYWEKSNIEINGKLDNTNTSLL